MKEIEIKAADNGFILEYEDEAICEENRKSDMGYKDPRMNRVYATAAALLSDLKVLLPKMSMEEAPEADAYKSAFKEAIKSEKP